MKHFLHNFVQKIFLLPLFVENNAHSSCSILAFGANCFQRMQIVHFSVILQDGALYRRPFFIVSYSLPTQKSLLCTGVTAVRLRSIIGKRRYAVLIVICLMAAAAALLWWQPWQAPAGSRAEDAANGLNRYSFDLIFRPDQRELAVTMTLDFTNRTGDALTDLTLRAWPGAYAREETSPAAIDALYDVCYPNGFQPGGIQMDGAWWNGSPADAAFSDDAETVLRVTIDPLPTDAQGQLTLRCRLTVPECAHRFGRIGDTWQFGNALPILSVYENGGWRTEAYCPIGDPFYSECANYDVTLITPDGYACAATGRTAVEKRNDGTLRYRMQANAIRDFAFALSTGWQEARQRVHGVQVTAYAPTSEGAKRAAADIARILPVYEALYGAYAWDTCTVCATEFPLGGMEYPTLIFADRSYFEKDWADTLELLLAHETAHQWFYGLVGSDPVFQPWQDEALCEYAMLRYVRQRYGQSAWENLKITRADAPMRERIPQPVTPATPITGFASPEIYSTVVYGRGAAFLLAVDELTGKLDGFLKAYCDSFAFSLAGRDDFETLLNAYTGEDLTPLMIDYLDTLMQ